MKRNILNEQNEDIIKRIWKLAGHDSATGNEKRLPYKTEVPFGNRRKVEKLLKMLYDDELPEWWDGKKNEANEPGIDVFNLSGINKKMNNLLGFDDFDKTFEPKKQKSTKRTEVGLDIINEKIEFLDEGASAPPVVIDKINEIIRYINAMTNPFTGMKEIGDFDDEYGPTRG